MLSLARAPRLVGTTLTMCISVQHAPQKCTMSALVPSQCPLPHHVYMECMECEITQPCSRACPLCVPLPCPPPGVQGVHGVAAAVRHPPHTGDAACFSCRAAVLNRVCTPRQGEVCRRMRAMHGRHPSWQHIHPSTTDGTFKPGLSRHVGLSLSCTFRWRVRQSVTPSCRQWMSSASSCGAPRRRSATPPTAPATLFCAVSTGQGQVWGVGLPAAHATPAYGM